MSKSASLALATFGLLVLGANPARAATMPSPPPSPGSALAGTLKDIGRVRAQTTFCRDVLDGAGAATNVALENDATLDDTAHFLGHVDLDENKLAKPQAVVELQKRYATISTSAQAAIGQAKRLEGLAATAPTTAQRDALVVYANAIGGALHRQQLLAASFRRFAMYLETHEQVAWQQHNEDLFYAARTPAGPFDHGGDPHERVAPLLSEIARQVSAQIEESRQPVTTDEIRASTVVAPAFDPCRGTHLAP